MTDVKPNEMTRDIWDKMSLEDRKEWNRPAYEALGVVDIEYLSRGLGGEEWFINTPSGGVDLDMPHRIKPTVRPPVVRYVILDPQSGEIKVSAWAVLHTSKELAEEACKEFPGCRVIKLVEEKSDE